MFTSVLWYVHAVFAEVLWCVKVMFTGVLMSLCSLVCLNHWFIGIFKLWWPLMCSLMYSGWCVQIIVLTGVFRPLCSWMCYGVFRSWSLVWSGHFVHGCVQVIVFTGVQVGLRGPGCWTPWMEWRLPQAYWSAGADGEQPQPNRWVSRDTSSFLVFVLILKEFSQTDTCWRQSLWERQLERAGDLYNEHFPKRVSQPTVLPDRLLFISHKREPWHHLC